jgi:hypothetical protein
MSTKTATKRSGTPMSEQRLSKLQKWILVNCYKVTVLFDRSSLKELKNAGASRKCRDCPKTRENVRLPEKQDDVPYHCATDGLPTSCSYFVFYKEDILLSYFSLPPNNGILHINRVQHFHSSPDYTKAHVSVHRSIGSLVDKGLIRAWSGFREESLMIWLTDAGIEKSADLMEKGGSESSVDP